MDSGYFTKGLGDFWAFRVIKNITAQIVIMIRVFMGKTGAAGIVS